MMSDYEVTLPDEDKIYDFHVAFHGPEKTPYEGGVWDVHVTLPPEYPYKSPSIGFSNRLFHPNVDDMSGSVCLDVINQTWSPMFDLINIFEVFLPQLLQDPNPTDPLNGEAAALLLRDPEAYRAKVQAYVHRYASGKPAAAEAPPSEAGSSSGGGNDSADEQKDEEEEGGSATDGIFKMEDVTMDDSDNDSDVSELSDIDT
mmetsp:Transcript_10501/g.17584  ORF Transcript_10501/g.17584 Transcript_10501/m.17584 type:complete len:201 (+) Transcript_10501:448-1050(+)